MAILRTRLFSIFRVYWNRVSSFHWNARMYLIHTIVFGASLGVRRLLFNFFVLSLGYDEALLGTLITINNLTAMLAALPMGHLADRLGRKRSLIGSAVLSSLSIVIMVTWPSAGMFMLTNIVMGLSMSLTSVTMGPFLMENSDGKERTYLFSFSSGLNTAAGFIGNWLGGYLPGWTGAYLHVDALSSGAYASALILVAAFSVFGIVPLVLIRPVRLAAGERSTINSFAYIKDHAGQFSRLIVPMLITSIGAGLIMPFMNVFFRGVHARSDAQIGTLFAWGSLAMGIGLLIAPALADRFGKIQVVVATQALSIPFLFMLGFSPWYWLSAIAYFFRLALMNMSSPVYQTFVMEEVDAKARATVASLVSMASTFGWAFSPMISGWIQVNSGFQPAFVLTLILYVISIYFYWRFFLKGHQDLSRQPISEKI